jgi:hypothetical protein
MRQHVLPLVDALLEGLGKGKDAKLADRALEELRCDLILAIRSTGQIAKGATNLETLRFLVRDEGAPGMARVSEALHSLREELPESLDGIVVSSDPVERRRAGTGLTRAMLDERVRTYLPQVATLYEDVRELEALHAVAERKAAAGTRVAERARGRSAERGASLPAVPHLSGAELRKALKLPVAVAALLSVGAGAVAGAGMVGQSSGGPADVARPSGTHGSPFDNGRNGDDLQMPGKVPPAGHGADHRHRVPQQEIRGERVRVVRAAARGAERGTRALEGKDIRTLSAAERKDGAQAVLTATVDRAVQAAMSGKALRGKELDVARKDIVDAGYGAQWWLNVMGNTEAGARVSDATIAFGEGRLSVRDLREVVQKAGHEVGVTVKDAGRLDRGTAAAKTVERQLNRTSLAG